MVRVFFVLFAALACNGSYVWGFDSDSLLYVLETDVKYVGGRSGVVNAANERTNLAFELYSAGMPPTASSKLAGIFSGMLLGTSDVGRTFIATPATPGFDKFAELLTDGQDQILSLPTAPEFGNTYLNESKWFHPHDAAIDLRGFVVDRITYTLKDWYYDTPGRDPNHNGFWTDTYFGYRISIEGRPVPEPVPLSLVTIAASCLVMRRKSRTIAPDFAPPSKNLAETRG